MSTAAAGHAQLFLLAPTTPTISTSLARASIRRTTAIVTTVSLSAVCRSRDLFHFLANKPLAKLEIFVIIISSMAIKVTRKDQNEANENLIRRFNR